MMLSPFLRWWSWGTLKDALKANEFNKIQLLKFRVTPIVTPSRRMLPFFRRAASADFHYQLTTGNAGKRARPPARKRPTPPSAQRPNNPTPR